MLATQLTLQDESGTLDKGGHKRDNARRKRHNGKLNMLACHRQSETLPYKTIA